MIHIDIDPNQIGKIYPADAALVGDARRSLEELAAALEDRIDSGARWREWREELAREKQTWNDDLRAVRTTPSFPYEPAYLATLLRELLPKETILVTGGGHPPRHRTALSLPGGAHPDRGQRIRDDGPGGGRPDRGCASPGRTPRWLP